jgi:hypothetical protein
LVGGRPAAPRVALKAALKLRHQVTSPLLPGKEHRCSAAPEAPRAELERLEPLEQKRRHRWSRPGELQLPDE